jgi:hypothetical protein
LWDTLVVNYMIILLYSYIRPVFSKKIKRNHPETVEKPHTLLCSLILSYIHTLLRGRTTQSPQELFNN